MLRMSSVEVCISLQDGGLLWTSKSSVKESGKIRPGVNYLPYTSFVIQRQGVC